MKRLLTVLTLAIVLLGGLLPATASAKSLELRPAAWAAQTYQNLATGYCLDSNANQDVYTHDCNSGSYQNWYVGHNWWSGTVTLQDVATGYCLDSNANQDVYTLGCNGGSYQNWYVWYNWDGTRTLRNMATGYCLDSNANQDVYTHNCNGGSYQKWY